MAVGMWAIAALAVGVGLVASLWAADRINRCIVPATLIVVSLLGFLAAEAAGADWRLVRYAGFYIGVFGMGAAAGDLAG